MTAAWLVGSSVHPDLATGRGGHDHEHRDGDDGTEYYFCGRGCYLEFGDDPGRYLDPSYLHSMLSSSQRRGQRTTCTAHPPSGMHRRRVGPRGHAAG